jgi:hypothetical protein
MGADTVQSSPELVAEAFVASSDGVPIILDLLQSPETAGWNDDQVSGGHARTRLSMGPQNTCGGSRLCPLLTACSYF